MQASPRPIDQSLEDLFHLSTQMKDQITLRRSPKMDRLCSAELTHQTAG